MNSSIVRVECPIVNMWGMLIDERHHRPRTTFRITITRLLAPKLPSGRNPMFRYIDSVPPQMNEFEYFLPLGRAIGYPSTVPLLSQQ